MSRQDAGTTDMLTGAQLVELFPTPVLSYDWPDSEDLNADLRRVITSKRELSPGVV